MSYFVRCFGEFDGKTCREETIILDGEPWPSPGERNKKLQSHFCFGGPTHSLTIFFTLHLPRQFSTIPRTMFDMKLVIIYPSFFRLQRERKPKQFGSSAKEIFFVSGIASFSSLFVQDQLDQRTIGISRQNLNEVQHVRVYSRESFGLFFFIREGSRLKRVASCHLELVITIFAQG